MSHGPNRFSRKIIPTTDKRLDEEGMSRLKSRMKKVGGTLMSDGWKSTTNKSVINVILGVDGIQSLCLVTDCSGQDKTISFICDLLCNVIEQLVSCAQRLHVSTVGLSRDGFTLKGGIGSIRR